MKIWAQVERCLDLIKRNQKGFLHRCVAIHPPVHAWIKKITSWVDSSRCKWSKTDSYSEISWQDYDIRHFVYDYLERGKTINSEFYMVLLNRLRANKEKKESTTSPGQCPFSHVNSVDEDDKNKDQIGWNMLWSTFLPTVRSKFVPQRLLTLHRHQKNAPEKELWLVIAETEVNFESKSFYIKGIKKLETHWYEYTSITFDGEYVDKWSRISKKKEKRKNCLFAKIYVYIQNVIK